MPLSYKLGLFPQTKEKSVGKRRKVLEKTHFQVLSALLEETH